NLTAITMQHGNQNLNTILVVHDLRFLLPEECPQIPASNANQASREVYDQWILVEVYHYISMTESKILLYLVNTLGILNM
ncbi:hypothetical protein, partial [Staphylococcus aureus]|uniref:hypothetical protein n=1 Tax=Staphylococcus aureus TaxID=1280 RepID=UPI0038B255D3